MIPSNVIWSSHERKQTISSPLLFFRKEVISQNLLRSVKMENSACSIVEHQLRYVMAGPSLKKYVPSHVSTIRSCVGMTPSNVIWSSHERKQTILFSFVSSFERQDSASKLVRNLHISQGDPLACSSTVSEQRLPSPQSKRRT